MTKQTKPIKPTGQTKPSSSKQTKATATASQKVQGAAPQAKETAGLTSLGSKTTYTFEGPDRAILEAFPNKYPAVDYRIRFEHPEFTSLCPMTGQPDFGTIIVTYVPDQKCVESKAFKLYMAAFRNHGSFMESVTNKIAEDLIGLLDPRRLTVEGIFNVRGGTGISVLVDYLNPQISGIKKETLLRLW